MPSGSQGLGSVLVTGASGFVGSAIAAEFRKSGYPVRVLVRASSPRVNIDPRDEVVVGDILDRTSVAAGLKGARYLVHAAADYRLWAPSPDDLLRANVEGSRIVMEEALRAGLERIVYTSSVATFDLRAGGLADETRHLPPTEAIGTYKRSKVIAERLVADMIARDRLPAVIVNPSTPIGPRDVKPTPTGRIIIEAASGRMPAFIETGLNFVHVDDVAAGHLVALQRGRIGERYILGGENVTLRQMLLDIAGIVGRRARPLPRPVQPGRAPVLRLLPHARAGRGQAGAARARGPAGRRPGLQRELRRRTPALRGPPRAKRVGPRHRPNALTAALAPPGALSA